jgi:LysM repeat protein
MQAARESKASRTSVRSAAHGAPGAERLVLGLALLLPLAVIVVAVAQIPGTSLASPSSLIPADTGATILGKRPASSNPNPPPTLAPPTATPRPTATPVPPTPTAQASHSPQKGGTYRVQPGDELRHIAADHNVSIWKIIAANDIPNPDSLRIGQELKIPTE